MIPFSVFPGVSVIKKLLLFYDKEPQGHQGGQYVCLPCGLCGLCSNEILFITTENHKDTREDSIVVFPDGVVGSAVIKTAISISTKQEGRQQYSLPWCLCGPQTVKRTLSVFEKPQRQ